MGVFSYANKKLAQLVEFSRKTADTANFTQFITQLLDTLKIEVIDPQKIV